MKTRPAAVRLVLAAAIGVAAAAGCDRSDTTPQTPPPKVPTPPPPAPTTPPRAQSAASPMQSAGSPAQSAGVPMQPARVPFVTVT